MTDSKDIWNAALLVIGDEILSGSIQDKNVAQVARWLNLQGIRLSEVRIVADDMKAIINAVNSLRANNDYLFTTGGIGPTHDDITVDAIAEALSVGVEIHPEARKMLEHHFSGRGGVSEGRLRMARVPAGAELIRNRMSGAPGIRIGNIFLMAGVPLITAGLLDALTGTLEGGLPVLSETMGIWAQESDVVDLLRDTENNHEKCVIGSYPFFRNGVAGANFVIRSTDPAKLKACCAELSRALQAIGTDPISGGI